MASFPCIRMLRTQIRPSVQFLLSSTDDNAHTNIWKLLFWAVRSVNIMQFNFFSMNSFWQWHFVFYVNILVYSKAFSTVTCAQRVCTNAYRRQAFNRRCQNKKKLFRSTLIHTASKLYRYLLNEYYSPYKTASYIHHTYCVYTQRYNMYSTYHLCHIL